MPRLRERISKTNVLLVVAGVVFGLVAGSLGAIAATRDRSGTDRSTQEVSASALDCPENAPINRTLSSGSSWTMCWRIDPYQGLTLENVHFTPAGKSPILILQSLALGQLEVPYDTGLRMTADITDQGFGGRNLQTLTAPECGGELQSSYVPNFGEGKVGGGEDREVLCVEEVDSGIAYRSKSGLTTEVARGNALSLSTISKVGWYEYVNQYVFGSDGSIRPELGATGDLSPEDYTDNPDQGTPVGPGSEEFAASHSHNAVWRVHWALGGRGQQSVEQYDGDFTGESGPKSEVIEGRLSPIETETKRILESRRWWRVVNQSKLNDDQHALSYEINIGATDSYRSTEGSDHAHGDEEPDGAEPAYDIAFSEYNECERYATENRVDGCSERTVSDYVSDGQKIDDVVAWVAVGFHHVARDEDQSPMEMHWQGFTMLPRDITAQRADVPTGRESLNGMPEGDQ